MIEINSCTKKFGDLTAVNNLSLTIQESDIFGLLGPNGAGKSTTIKMMVGLLKPDKGSIRIEGHDISRDPVKAKKLLAYVPEKSNLFEKLTAWEYLTFISGLYTMDGDVFQKNAEEYLKTFALFDWKDEVIENFSFGMKQRLVLASSFMREPKVLILDEPHNGLDPKGIRLLKDVMFTLRKRGMTILVSTHIIALAEQLCNRIVIMNKGMVAAQGTSDSLRQYSKSEDKTLEDIFLRLTSNYEQ
ncbi:ABC transporter ATP-binding protein [bacterium]|nr:MAG: ABC transporter ATP-binding protein [bacterium]